MGFIKNGKTYMVTDWRNNLILDSGLNKVAGSLWSDCWGVCLFGNGVSPTPVERTSGATTISQAVNTLTASGGFFQSSDVGRLFKFDSGNEVYITAFTSSTLVTCGGPSTTVSASPGAVWYVNDTTLNSLYSATSSYQQNAGDNGTTVSSNVITCKRTFVGSAVTGSPVTLTEIGFNDGGSNVNLFDRDIIPGGITLLVGDQPLAIAELITTVTPMVSTAAGNVGTGYDSSGDAIISGLGGVSGATVSAVDSTGATTYDFPCFEPSYSDNRILFIATASFTLAAFSNSLGPSFPASVVPSGIALGTYSAGNFFRDFTHNYATSNGNGTIFGVGLGVNGRCSWQQKFTTPFTKTSAQTLNFVIRKSWQRILTN